MANSPSTLRERAAQLIFPRLGSNMQPRTSADDDASRFAELLERLPIGGLVLFHGHRGTTPDTLRDLQRLARFPLLVAADLERGSGQQLHGGAVFPHAMAFGACGDRATDFVRRAAKLTATDAIAGGVHWLFAPVADVHSNPKNPIISTRAFGREEHRVAELVEAFIAGSHEGGALTTAKHFPGHGDTATDSHAALPFVSRSRESLEAVELVPFRAAFDAGVDSVMTAHVAYPAFGSGNRSATWSPEILRVLLREELGYDGVVISDSLLMAGAGPEIAKRAPALVAAGVDVLLDLESPETALDALVTAVESGRLPERILDDAFRRVWRLKTGLMDRFGEQVFVDPPVWPDARQEAATLATDVAAAALVELGDPPGPTEPQNVRILVVRPHTDYPDPTQASIETVFAQRFPDATIESIGPDYQSVPSILESVGPDEVVIVTAVVKPAAWRHFGLLLEQQQLIDQLIDRNQTVMCVLGSPDVLPRFERAAFRICSFSDVTASVEAAAERLHNRIIWSPAP